MPLKIGIFADIREQCQDIPEHLLRWAIEDYTDGCSYHASVISGANRINLDGKPCGTVEPAHAQHSDEKLALAPPDVRERWRPRA